MPRARKVQLFFLLLWVAIPIGDLLLADGTNDWIPELDTWGYSVELRGAGGYKDNLLLEKSKRESSYFLSAGSDMTIWRLPIDRHQFLFLMSGDYFNYPDGRDLKNEAAGVAVAQYKNLLTSSLEFGGLAQYSYLDQVLGVLTSTNFNPIPVTAHVVGLRPSLRQYLASHWWMEGEGYGGRHYYESPLDDLWEGGFRLHMGRDYGNRSLIQSSYKYTKRIYDSQNALEADGTAMDRVLRMDQHDVELIWNHHWDSDRRWRSSTQLGLQLLRDNGAGFFDYNRYQVQEKLRYRNSKWEIEGQLRVAFYDFLVQKSRSDGGTRTEKTLFSLQCRLSRTINENLSIYGWFERDDSLSNRDEDDYSANKIGVGVDWEFQ